MTPDLEVMGNDFENTYCTYKVDRDYPVCLSKVLLGPLLVSLIAEGQDNYVRLEVEAVVKTGVRRKVCGIEVEWPGLYLEANLQVPGLLCQKLQVPGGQDQVGPLRLGELSGQGLGYVGIGPQDEHIHIKPPSGGTAGN